MLTNFALWKESFGQEGSKGPGVRFPTERRHPGLPAWKTGFVSTAHSYKARIASEEAQQTRDASNQVANQVTGQFRHRLRRIIRRRNLNRENQVSGQKPMPCPRRRASTPSSGLVRH